MNWDEERDYFLAEIHTPDGQKALVSKVSELIKLLRGAEKDTRLKLFLQAKDLLEIAFYNARDRRFLTPLAMEVINPLKEETDLELSSLLIRLLQYFPMSAEVVARETVNILLKYLSSENPWIIGMVARVGYYLANDLPITYHQEIHAKAIAEYNNALPAWRKEPLILLLASTLTPETRETCQLLSEEIGNMLDEPGKRGRNILWASLLLLRKKELCGSYLDLFVPKALRRAARENSPEFLAQFLIHLEDFSDVTLQEWKDAIITAVHAAKRTQAVNAKLIENIGQRLGIIFT